MNSIPDTTIPDYSKFRLGLLIPFFNEADRTDTGAFISFATQHKDVLLVLINDGSSDNTLQVLEYIRNSSPSNTEIVNLVTNLGKANALRQGMQIPVKNNIPFTGYMDADLSVSFDEILRLFNLAAGSESIAIFGSRIKRLGSQIERTLFRHISGRMIATILDTRFKIGCYDTQCGAKIFKTPHLKDVIQTPFYTKWFIDVEILLRMRKESKALPVLETPLLSWKHKPGSKLKARSVFTIIREISALLSKY